MRSLSHAVGKHGQTSGAKKEKGKRNNRSGKNNLRVVGIGPGAKEHMTEKALQALSSADLIVGYSTYIDQVRPVLPDKKYFVSGMQKEIERVSAAVKSATQGTSTAIVCGGDPGIYALACLVFEVCQSSRVRIFSDAPENLKKETPYICLEIISGIPALSSCASLLGAPLTHDFASVSLSNLLTPWHVIEKRLDAAAYADFVIVLYNPKSKKRDWQLRKALDVIGKHRDPATPVGIVTRAMREAQSLSLTTLQNVDVEKVGMQSTVFIGNSKTFTHDGYMVTPRGYEDKYDLKLI